MKIGLPYVTQIRSGDDAPTVFGFIAQTFNQLVSGVTAGYHIEHAADDTHGNIHALTISERARTIPLGEWITPVFQPTDFSTVAVGTWTVTSANLARFAYTLVGKTMTVAVYIVSSTITGGTPSFLTIKIPGGYKSAAYTFNACCVANAGTRAVGYLGVNPTTATDQGLIYIDSGTGSWSLAANNTSVFGELSFEVM